MGIYQGHNWQGQGWAIARSGQASHVSSVNWNETFPAWFQQLPPERIGPNGEYDYYGLQKRVEAELRRHFPPRVLQGLRVSQRGRVVIFQGTLSDPRILPRLVDIAQSVEGTYRVEAQAVLCPDVSAVAIAG